MSKSTDPDGRVEILEHSAAYRGYFELDRYRLRHRKHDGGWTPPLMREVLNRGHTVALLPYDAVRDTVVLIEQFRIGAYAAGVESWQVEAVAGVIEPGEEAGDVARREALEEAGCEVSDLEAIGAVLLSSGASSETAHMFCGRVSTDGIGGIHGLAHEGEDIRAIVLPADQAIARIGEAEAISAYTVIPLQWLAINRERLRAQWT